MMGVGRRLAQAALRQGLAAHEAFVKICCDNALLPGRSVVKYGPD